MQPTIDIDQATERLVIFLPSVHVEGEGHHIHIPLNLDGLRLLYDTLVQRQRLLQKDKEKLRIGSTGHITQAQVETILKELNKKKAQQAKEDTAEKLRNLGLDDETISLVEGLDI